MTRSAQRAGSRIEKRTSYPRLGAEQEAIRRSGVQVIVNRHDDRYLSQRGETEREGAVRMIYESNSLFGLRCLWIVFCQGIWCFRRM